MSTPNHNNNSKYPGSPFRSPASPSLKSRQASIVEMLSTPPPLENNSDIASLHLNDSQASLSPTNASFAHPGSATTSTSASALHRNPSLASQYSSGSIPPAAAAAAQATGSAHSHFDWQDIQLAELVEKNKLIFIKDSVSVEKAFETLIKNNLTSVPVETCDNDLNCLTFDYTDLNSHLLLVLNKLRLDLNEIDYQPREDIPNLILKAQRGEAIPVKFVIRLSTKNPFIKLSEFETLAKVVEILGSGVHRVAITNDDSITAILSQRRLIKYLWDNARRFPSMDQIFQSSLHELNIGQSNVISIYGDQLLIEALTTMHDLKISSVAVIDRNNNLLGNISVTDVKHVSTSSKTDLLYKSCLHFISIILNSRGLENGKDSFPIFHVTPNSSLGRTIAKLVATQAHRLWIVRPSGSSISSESSASSTPSTPGTQQIPNYLMEKDSARPGKLIGVVSLTDILSLFAKRLGKNTDPGSARRQRRRSSSSSSRSIISSSSLEQLRKSSTGNSASNNPIEFR